MNQGCASTGLSQANTGTLSRWAAAERLAQGGSTCHSTERLSKHRGKKIKGKKKNNPNHIPVAIFDKQHGRWKTKLKPCLEPCIAHTTAAGLSRAGEHRNAVKTQMPTQGASLLVPKRQPLAAGTVWG